MGIRVLKLVALASAAALLLLPATALAKKKHKKKPINLGPVVTVTSDSNVTGPGPGEATATATCPAGLGAVGGGFTAPLGPGLAIPIHDSYMSSPTSWTVSGRNQAGTGSVSATVYCRNTTRAPVTDIPAAVPVTGVGATGTATPACPGTSRLIDGGFQSTTGTNSGDMLLVKTNMATSATVWTVAAVNVESSESFTLTAHAYCMSGITPPTILSAESSAPAVQNTSVEATTPTCPVPAKPKRKKGKKKRKKKPAQLLSAGGFSTPFRTLANPPEGAVGTSRIGATGGWSGRVTNVTNGVGTLSLTIQGICV